MTWYLVWFVIFRWRYGKYTVLYFKVKKRKNNRTEFIGVKGEDWDEEIQITRVALPSCNRRTSIHSFYVVASLLLSSSSPHSFNFHVTPHPSFLTLTLMLFTFFTSLPSTLFWDTNTLPVPRFQWLHVSLPSLYFLLFLLIDWLTNYELLLQKGRKVFFHTPFSVHSFLFCMCFAVSEAVWLMWYQNWYIFFHFYSTV